MKNLILSFFIIAGATSAFAGNKISNPETAVGAEVILRQIATSKYFGKDGLRAVKAALEGSYGSTLSADITSMDCEPALGVNECLIKLSVIESSRPPGFEDISFDVQVRIYQGKILSGGPVPVEY